VALELNQLPGVLVDEPLHTALDRKGLATEGKHLGTIEEQALVPARGVECGLDLLPGADLNQRSRLEPARWGRLGGPSRGAVGHELLARDQMKPAADLAE